MRVRPAAAAAGGSEEALDEMLGFRFRFCGRCRLAWAPEKKGGTAITDCPRCRRRSLPAPEPFHAGVLLVVAGLVLGGAQLARSPPAAAETVAGAERAPGQGVRPPVERARVKARVVIDVTAGPRRGRTVILRRGQTVKVLRREGSTLLVQDGEGNRMYIANNQVAAL